jgi:enediyne biosynthesis protein E4
MIRLRYPHGLGPAREIQAGAGYWSQNSAVQVLGLETNPTSVWIRWPGGCVTETSIPEGVQEVRIELDGRLASHPGAG